MSLLKKVHLFNQLELYEFADFLGIDIQNDQHYIYLAREALKTPLPANWKIYRNREHQIYYLNEEDQTLHEENPNFEYYRQEYQRLKRQENKREGKKRSRLNDMIQMNRQANQTQLDDEDLMDINIQSNLSQKLKMVQEQQSQNRKQFDRSKLKSKSRSDIFIQDDIMDEKVNQFNMDDHNQNSYQLNADENNQAMIKMDLSYDEQIDKKYLSVSQDLESSEGSARHKEMLKSKVQQIQKSLDEQQVLTEYSIYDIYDNDQEQEQEQQKSQITRQSFRLTVQKSHQSIAKQQYRSKCRKYKKKKVESNKQFDINQKIKQIRDDLQSTFHNYCHQQKNKQKQINERNKETFKVEQEIELKQRIEKYRKHFEIDKRSVDLRVNAQNVESIKRRIERQIQVDKTQSQIQFDLMLSKCKQEMMSEHMNMTAQMKKMMIKEREDEYQRVKNKRIQINMIYDQEYRNQAREMRDRFKKDREYQSKYELELANQSIESKKEQFRKEINYTQQKQKDIRQMILRYEQKIRMIEQYNDLLKQKITDYDRNIKLNQSGYQMYFSYKTQKYRTPQVKQINTNDNTSVSKPNKLIINENNSSLVKQNYSLYYQDKKQNKKKSRLLTNDSLSYAGEDMMNSIMLSQMKYSRVCISNIDEQLDGMHRKLYK